MKFHHIILLGFIALIGSLQTALFAFDAKKVFVEADSFYVKGGEETRKALPLFESIISDGSDEKYVKLAKLKKSFIYDEHLMEYENAMRAYQVFMNDYPKNRLIKIVRSKHDLLKMLQDNKALEDYKEFRTLEAELKSRRRGQNATKAERARATMALYKYCLKNLNKKYNEQLLSVTLATLVQERYFMKAASLMATIDEKVPDMTDVYQPYIDVIGINTTRLYCYYTGIGIIAICALFAFLGKGHTHVKPILKQYKKPLIYSTICLFLFIAVYYEVIVTEDPEKEFNYSYMFFIFFEYILLVPLAIALNSAFSDKKRSTLLLSTQFVLTILLGISTWIVFAHNYDYLWLLGL